MRSCILLLVIAIIIPSAVFAQQRWEMNYGGAGDDRGYSVQQTTDTGYIVAGYTNSFGNGYQVYLIKTNASGDTLWTRNYGGAGYDMGHSVQQTKDTGYIIAGYTNSFGNSYQVYLIKTNANGETLWTRTYGGTGDEAGYSVGLTTDQGYIIAGEANSFGNSFQIYLVRIDSTGDTLWTRTYGGTEDDFGSSVQQTLDGGYVVAGTLGNSGTPFSLIYLFKTNASGDTLWSLTSRGPFLENYGSSVQQTTDTGYIVSGVSIDAMAGDVVSLLIKTDAFGGTLWVRGDGSPGGGQCVQQTLDEGYIVAGYASTIGGPSACFGKANASGYTLWERRCPQRSCFFSVQQTSDGGYIVAGMSTYFGNGYQVYLIKTDTNGSTGVEESPTTEVRNTNFCATIVRGLLNLQSSISNLKSEIVLLDITGRKVMDLHTGSNNIRHLSPGVYFIRSNNSKQVTKIIVTK